MGSGKLLKRAISKYGLANFSKEILYIFSTEEEMNVKEKELVIVSEETYNLCEGGKGGFGYINTNSVSYAKRFKPQKEYTKKLISNSLSLFYKNNPDVVQMHIFRLKDKNIRLKASKSYRGFKHSKETKIKIGSINSIKQQGSKNSQYGTCWITNGQENKKIKKEDVDKWIELGYTKGRK